MGHGTAAMAQETATDLECRLAQAQRELTEAREQQRATAEILGVISSLSADMQPVFDTIVRNFVLLCGSVFGGIYTFDGELVHFAGAYGFTPEQLAEVKKKYPVRIDDPSVLPTRAILARAPVHIEDVISDAQYDRQHVAARAYAGYSRCRCFAKAFPWAQSWPRGPRLAPRRSSTRIC